jgi:hypothetical protein
VNDEFDVAVHDAEALAEIEMLTNLIIATSEYEGPVPERRIDEILGVAPGDEEPPSSDADTGPEAQRGPTEASSSDPHGTA